jgi:hypothetical protein
MVYHGEYCYNRAKYSSPTSNVSMLLACEGVWGFGLERRLEQDSTENPLRTVGLSVVDVRGSAVT